MTHLLNINSGMVKINIKKLSVLFRIEMVCLALIYGCIGKSNAQESQVHLPATNYYLSSDRSVDPVLDITNPPSAFALKTNLLYAATLTPNLALEVGLGKKTSLEIGGGYNFYESDNGKRWKHWLVQPEFRYWLCERFNGTFLGVHALGGEYNFAKIDLPFSVFKGLKDNRYEGHFYGGGLVVGYQWILSKRWNLEVSVGGGYVRVHYDKYDCATCGSSVENDVKNYWGPTKAAVSLLLFL